MDGWYLILLPALPAAVMSVSDFRERSVSVPSVAAFVLCSLAFSILTGGIRVTLTRLAFNLALLILFSALLLAYWRIRYGKSGGMIDRAFGKGDILFLAGAAPLLDPVPFCLFIAASCLAGILWARLSSRKEIPFVGFGAPVLSLFLINSYLL